MQSAQFKYMRGGGKGKKGKERKKKEQSDAISVLRSKAGQTPGYPRFVVCFGEGKREKKRGEMGLPPRTTL